MLRTIPESSSISTHLKGSPPAMVSVLSVHGVGQQYKGEWVVRDEWLPSLLSGMALASGLDAARLCDFRFAFYGDLFRPEGRMLGDSDSSSPIDFLTQSEMELLDDMWRAAADTDPGVMPPDSRTLSGAPAPVQAALRALSASKFFGNAAAKSMPGKLKQMRRYLTSDELRADIWTRVASQLSSDTRVVIGHSMGSVVAYEALCAHPEWPVRTLITIGSPLGIRNVVFDRLKPCPAPGDGMNGRLKGQWPGSVSAWINIADRTDVVALVKDLRPQFSDRILCHVIDNGVRAHDAKPYLTSIEVGRAVVDGLRI
jgi:pimeloyl-ACP methyl ester carboxylesterase